MPPQVAQVLAAALAELAHQQRFAVHCRQLLILAGLWETAPVAALPLSPNTQPQKTAAPVPVAQQLHAAVQQRRTRSDVLRRIADEPRGKLVPLQSQAVVIAGPYEVYSRQHDVVQRADRICTAAQAALLQQRLNQVTAATMRSQSAAALRLQRCVMSSKPLRWQSDAETGVLDPARLTSVLTDPLQPARLRSRQEAVAPDTHVTLLVDNSGSLRGKPIEMAAASVLLLVSALERCGVATEVLGFTTMGWRGGKAAVQWRTAGSPARPGRIAALRHLVYKSPAESAARCRKQLAAMLHDDLLRENVDGEALQWALQRLRRSPAKRRILMVLCDGTPQEQATAQANGPLYLQRHLQQVVAATGAAKDVQLIAIGLARDVSSCYPQALVVEELQQLGAALPQQLVQLLKPGARRPTYPGRVSP
jgi:cobaltochelatase CobT